MIPAALSVAAVAILITLTIIEHLCERRARR